MKFQKLFLIFFSLFLCNVAYSQNIIKIVKQYVLISNVDESSSLAIGDKVPVYRKMNSGTVSWVGEIQVMKFVKGKCAAKIISEGGNYQIAVGDFIDLTTNSNEISFSEKSGSSFSAGPGDVGIEKGDSEIQFAGFYMKMISKYFDMGGTAFIQVSYAKFITSRFQIGIAPQITISQGSGSETQTNISASAFFNYNLATASKMIPYVSGQLYQGDFSPEYGDFMDYSFINVGAGLRNFLNQFAALNTSISYGFALSSANEGGILIIMSGLSFIF